MALGNYVIVLKQAWLGKAAYNIFNYFDESSAGLTDSNELAIHMRDEILPEINAFQHTGIANISIYCYNSTTGVDSSTLYITGNGTRVVANDNRQVPYQAVTFKWNVATTQYGPAANIIKRGFNRFWGVSDTDCDNGRLVSTWAGAFGDSLRDVLLTPKSIGSATYRFCIHRPGAVWKIATVTGASGYKLGSQNTRKI